MVVNRPLLTELLQLLFAHSVQKLPFSCDEESIVENDRYYYPRWWRKEERDDPLERRILLATNKVLREQSHDGGKGNSWVGGERGAAGRLARGWDKTLSAQRGAMFPGAVRGGEGPLAALSNWFVVSDTPPPVNEWYNNWVHKQWPMKQFLMQGSEGGCVLCMRYTDLQCTLYIYRYIIDRFNEIRVSTPAYILSRNIIMKSGSWLLDYIEFISNEYLRKNGMELTLSTFQLVWRGRDY